MVRNVHPFHQVLIMSEEQFKIFSLPALNPTGKYKVAQYLISLILCILLIMLCQVTANEGVVVRRTRATSLESLGVSRQVQPRATCKIIKMEGIENILSLSTES